MSWCWPSGFNGWPGQYRDRFCTQEIVVPNSQETHEYGLVALKGSGAEVFVHLVKAFQQGTEVIRTNGEHRRKADRRHAPCQPRITAEDADRVPLEGELRGPSTQVSRRAVDP
jgi:hypothetical protein